DRPHEVDVRDRIEGQTVRKSCRRVPEGVSSEAVGHLVDDYGENKDDKRENNGHSCSFGALWYHASTMARACEITGKSTQVGGRYSNRVRATQFNPTGKVRRKANLQKRRIYVPELGKTVVVDLSMK